MYGVIALVLVAGVASAGESFSYACQGCEWPKPHCCHFPQGCCDTRDFRNGGRHRSPIFLKSPARKLGMVVKVAVAAAVCVAVVSAVVVCCLRLRVARSDTRCVVLSPQPTNQTYPVQPAYQTFAVQPACQTFPVQPSYQTFPVQPAYQPNPLQPENQYK